MNSTERLLACLRGEIPDRVPISTYELVGWDAEAWQNRQPSYRRLMDLIRAKTDCMYLCQVSVPNVRQTEWNVEVETWDQADQHVTKRVIRTPTRQLTAVRSRSDDLQTTWTREHPVKDLDDLAAYLELPWEPGEPDFGELEKAWRDLDQGRGLPHISVADPICELAEAFEFGNFLVHAITETRRIAAALDCLHERYVERLGRILTGPVQNAVVRICGAEYATPPYLSPEYFADFVTPYVKRMSDILHQYGAKMRLHCHGKIAKVLDEIMKTEPDAMDPVEPPPDGDIELAQVKKQIGDKVCLFGNLELKLLEHGTPEQVRAFVIDAMTQAKANGRFVIMPTAAPINDPLWQKTLQNYTVFIETALKHGKY